MSVRVVVADDHPMYRFGLGAVLAQSDGIEVVASVSSGDELVAAVTEHRPDVVVTDLSMPGTDGVAAMQIVLEEHPGLAVLALTMHDDDQHVRAALRAGASGYLVKGADGESIVRAVHAVAAGDAVYGGEVAGLLTAGLADAPTTGSDTSLPPLTPRERDVLELLVVGCRTREIGQRLGMSEKTVRNHVSHLLVKFAVEDRTGLALRARDAGLGPAAPDGVSRR
jgi:DNA-binding NarL/FixJ family response regulator